MLKVADIPAERTALEADPTDREDAAGAVPAAGLRALAAILPLLRAWTWRLIRARYQQSLLGGAWAVLQPAATIAIVSVVFTRFVEVDTGGVPYVLFASVAVVPWTLAAASLSDMVASLVDNLNLVTKVAFAREALPLAALAARLLDFAIAMLLVIGLLGLSGRLLVNPAYLWLPVIIAVQCVLLAGLGLAGAAANVFYRDIKPVVALGLQVWLYLSPVLYSSAAVPEAYRGLYFLNPMAGIIEGYRSVLLHGRSPGPALAMAGAVAIVTAWVSYVAFKRLEPRFADVV